MVLLKKKKTKTQQFDSFRNGFCLIGYKPNTYTYTSLGSHLRQEEKLIVKMILAYFGYSY